jgi:hypothetical protein
VLYKSFFEANGAREFLSSSSNFKDKEKNNFTVNWYKDEYGKDLPESLTAQFSKLTIKAKKNSFKDQINKSNLISMQSDNNNKNLSSQMNTINHLNSFEEKKEKNCFNINSYNNSIQTIIGKDPAVNNNIIINNAKYPETAFSNGLMQGIDKNNYFNTGVCYQNAENTNAGENKSNKQSEIHKESSNGEKPNQHQNGKFTSRFELLIENDKEFQVGRRLIGSKVKLQ